MQTGGQDPCPGLWEPLVPERRGRRARASGPLSIVGAGVRPARPGGDRRTRPRQLVLQQHEPRPRPAAAPVPGQRPGSLPCPAQREQPWGLFALRYRTAARASAPTLTSGSVLPRLCRPHVRPGHLVSFPGQSAHCRLTHRPPPLPSPAHPLAGLSPHSPSPSRPLTLRLIHALSVPECPPCTPSLPPGLQLPALPLSCETPRPDLSPAQGRLCCLSGQGAGRVWGKLPPRRGPHLCPLPVRAQAKVHHYRISTAAGGLYLQKGRLFPSLEELLAYYKANWKLTQSPLLQPHVPQVGQAPAAPPAQLASTRPGL